METEELFILYLTKLRNKDYTPCDGYYPTMFSESLRVYNNAVSAAAFNLDFIIHCYKTYDSEVKIKTLIQASYIIKRELIEVHIKNDDNTQIEVYSINNKDDYFNLSLVHNMGISYDCLKNIQTNFIIEKYSVMLFLDDFDNSNTLNTLHT